MQLQLKYNLQTTKTDKTFMERLRTISKIASVF